MLSTTKLLHGYTLHSRDGEIGTVKEFYFDDRHWTVRYLVAETGTWLFGRKVLISPYALVGMDKTDRHITVDLTKKQIEDSPSLESHKPVSRQFEEQYLGYYGWPMYWSGPYSWGAYPYISRDSKQWNNVTQVGRAWDPHLCSTKDVTGHHIQASDGEVGHVKDFIIDDQNWAIRYLIVDTQNWWPGKKVLISPRWIESVSWPESKVFVNVTRDRIKHAAEFTEESLITRDYETGLHQHYDRRGYWIDERIVAPAC
jgi:uncharacterized protein YrrD